MDKGLEGKRCSGMYASNLLQRQFACKHNLRIPCRFKEPCALRRAVVHLSRGMQGYRRQVESQECKVLGDEGIDTSIVKFAYKAFDCRNLIVVKDSIERDINPGIIKVRKVTQATYVVDTVSGCGTRSESRSANIHSISTVEDGLYADICSLGRSQQFNILLLRHEWLG